MNTLFPVNTPERCDELIRAARLRRVAREAANAAFFSAHLKTFSLRNSAQTRLPTWGTAKATGIDPTELGQG